MKTTEMERLDSAAPNGATAQLDLGLGARERKARCATGYRRRRQTLLARAQWWFGQMRQVVDNAVEWKPAAGPRPEQTTFELRRGEAMEASR